IYVFGPDADAKVYLSSADWMPRNFYRRVEVMFPIEQADLRDRILHEIVPAYLMDNVKSRVLQPDGTYVRVRPTEGEAPFRVQERLLALRPGTTTAASDMRLASAAIANGTPMELLPGENVGLNGELSDGAIHEGNGNSFAEGEALRGGRAGQR
ncbi:MAG TPA: hypothetical protein VGI75_04445, partial [Pirellulales bacterium]